MYNSLNEFRYFIMNPYLHISIDRYDNYIFKILDDIVSEPLPTPETLKPLVLKLPEKVRVLVGLVAAELVFPLWDDWSKEYIKKSPPANWSVAIKKAFNAAKAFIYDMPFQLSVLERTIRNIVISVGVAADSAYNEAEITHVDALYNQTIMAALAAQSAMAVARSVEYGITDILNTKPLPLEEQKKLSPPSAAAITLASKAYHGAYHLWPNFPSEPFFELWKDKVRDRLSEDEETFNHWLLTGQGGFQ